MKESCARYFSPIKKWLFVVSLFITAGVVHAHPDFTPALPVVIGASSSAYSAAVIDVNGDGKLDLIVPNISLGVVKVFTNSGDGHFASNPASYRVSNSPHWVTTAVIQPGGLPAIICANDNDNTLSVLTNNGSGVFGSNATYNVGHYPRCVIASDINGDGKLDLVCANRDDNSLSVLTNNGSGIFGSNATYTVDGPPYSVIAADINGSGRSALICANYYPSDSLTILTNNGGGIFSSNATIYSVGVGPESVTAADIDGSGKQALIVASYYSQGLIVLKNNGSGIFSSNALLNAGTQVTWGTAADLNGDGKIDLISADNNGNSLTIFTNDGGGIFSSNSTLNVPFSSYPINIVAADLNHDGGQDLISVNFYGDAVSVFLNKQIYALNIKHAGNTVNVSWPSVWANWILEQSPSLTATNWLASTGAVDDGTNKNLTVSASAGNLFFRLKQ